MKAPGYEEMQDWRAGLLPYWSSQPTGWLRKAVTRRQPFRLHRCADLVRNGEQHMGYTLGQAAKAVGMSKTSILRSIKTGRISAGRDEFGQWAIEPCELHRVYPALTEDTVTGNGTEERA